jgi:rSAM/selenodomain-associated transferase 2
VNPLPISVVIPTLDEAERIESTVSSVLRSDEVECVVIDGGSRDDTVARALRAGARVAHASRGRAVQLNAGARMATHPLLVFLHADTILPLGYERVVRRILADPGVACGAFRLHIEPATSSLRAIERIANLRARRLALPYGDQALFVRADRFHQLGGFPDLPIMEDFEFVRRLRRTGRVEIASEAVATSSRRWRRYGTWRTTAMHQLALLAYLGGIRATTIARWTAR